MKCIECGAHVEPVFVIRDTGPGLGCPNCAAAMRAPEPVTSGMLTLETHRVIPETKAFPVGNSDVIGVIRARLGQLDIEIADLESKRAEADMLRKMLGVADKVKSNGASAL